MSARDSAGVDNGDLRPAYIRVVVIECFVIVALWLAGRWFSA